LVALGTAPHQKRSGTMTSQSTEKKRSIADRIKQSDILVLILALAALCAITYFLKPSSSPSATS
jgi:hypothetical protein